MTGHYSTSIVHLVRMFFLNEIILLDTLIASLAEYNYADKQIKKWFQLEYKKFMVMNKHFPITFILSFTS